MFGSKPKKLKSTRFSDFIRNASAGEKKKLYEKVLQRATERQRRVLESASAKS